MATELDDLRAKIEELQSLDLDKLRARVQLLAARVDLEEIAERIAQDTDTDADVVLLVVQASWFARIDHDLDTTSDVDADAFRSKVEASVRRVMAALAEGVTEVDDPVDAEALRRAIDLGRQGITITPTRETLNSFASMIDPSQLER